MKPNLQDLIELLAEICEERKLRAAVSESLKGGLLTGFSSVVGGLLLGPVGLAVGGIVGGGLSAISAKNKFQSVAVILRNMNQTQKLKLYERLKHAFRDFNPQDVAALSMLLLSQKSLTELAIREVLNFLSSNMSVAVQS